jgi:hypothetical protein
VHDDKRREHCVLHSAQYGNGGKPRSAGIFISSRQEIVDHVKNVEDEWKDLAHDSPHCANSVVALNVNWAHSKKKGDALKQVDARLGMMLSAGLEEAQNQRKLLEERKTLT